MIGIRLLGVIFIGWFLAACQGNAFTIHVRFPDVKGLVKEDRVLLNEQQIGKVAGVKYTSKADFLVDIAVAEQFKAKLTDKARFYVVQDPGRPGRAAVEVFASGEGGNPLQEGAVVQGSTKTEDMVNDLFASMQEGLRELEGQLEEFVDNLKEIPQKEEIERLRKELARLAEQMKRAGKSAKEKLEKEVIPRIEQEIQRLKEKLRKLGREDEAKPLEVELEQLKKI